MWLIIAFAATGFLIGNLMAMSASSTVPSFLGLLFALLGGSLIALLHKLTIEDRVLAGKLVLALTGMCLIGVYTGLLVNEHELLTPKQRRFLTVAPMKTAKAAPCGADKEGRSESARGKYIAAGEISEADEIDIEKRAGKLTAEQAYGRLFNAWKDSCKE